MIKKYVLDPDATHDVLALVRFLDGLGVEHGRLLAEYPKRWRSLVYERFSKTSSTRTLKLLEDIIKQITIEGALRTKSGVDYDPELGWVDNAANNAEAFAAILYADEAKDIPTHPALHPISTMTQVPLPEYWHVDRDIEVPNRASALVAHLRPFLELEPTVALMDPYFNPNDAYTAFLREVLKEIPSLTLVTIHSAQNAKSKEDWSNQWQERLSSLLSPGATIHIVRWRDSYERRPHPRWVINRRGGIRFDKGFGQDNFTNELTLLSSSFAVRRWNQFGRDRRNIGETWTDEDHYSFRDAVTFTH